MNEWKTLENYPVTCVETIEIFLKLLESDKTGPQRRVQKKRKKQKLETNNEIKTNLVLQQGWKTSFQLNRDKQENETTGYKHNLLFEEIHVVLENTNKNRKANGADTLNQGLSKYVSYVLNINC